MEIMTAHKPTQPPGSPVPPAPGASPPPQLDAPPSIPTESLALPGNTPRASAGPNSGESSLPPGKTGPASSGLGGTHPGSAQPVGPQGLPFASPVTESLRFARASASAEGEPPFLNPSHVLSLQSAPAVPTRESQLGGVSAGTPRQAQLETAGFSANPAAAGPTEILEERNPFTDSLHVFGTAAQHTGFEHLVQRPNDLSEDPLVSRSESPGSPAGHAAIETVALSPTGPIATQTEELNPDPLARQPGPGPGAPAKPGAGPGNPRSSGTERAGSAGSSQRWSSRQWPFLRPRQVDFPLNLHEGTPWPEQVHDDQTVAFSSPGGEADFQIFYERSLRSLKSGSKAYFALPLGKGGEGTVYRAMQLSLAREVAVKMPTGQRSGEANRALEEAVVIGYLDHPHIVPIHDVGRDQQGRLFYAMKLVRGKHWRDSIAQSAPPQPHSGTHTFPTLSEAARLDSDLEIFLKVCDAVSFAHSKGILHRDLKPDNVLVGAFGEVYVSDWGAAVALPNSRLPVALNPRPGFGTYSYMAPEGLDDIARLDVTLDIYLLGGILWKLLNGYAPRGEKPDDASSPPLADRRRAELITINYVCEPDLDRMQRLGTEELVEVARRALSTFPADRHPSVADLRGAVVRCRKHLVSVKAGQRARQTLESATVSADYAKALAQFEDARASWDDVAVEDSEWRGDPAMGLGASASAQWQKLVDGENETRLRYAAHAESTENYELGLSLLSPERPDHAPLRARLRQRQEESGRRARLLTVFRRLAVALLIATALAGSVAGVQYYRAIAAGLDRKAAEKDRDAAQIAKTEAVKETKQAKDEQVKAEEKTRKATQQLTDANQKLTKASEQLDAATQEKLAAERLTKAAQSELQEVEKRRQQAEYASLVARFETAFEDGRWKDAVRLRSELKTKSQELNLLINSVLNAKFRALDRQIEPTDEPDPPRDPAANTPSQATPSQAFPSQAFPSRRQSRVALPSPAFPAERSSSFAARSPRLRERPVSRRSPATTAPVFHTVAHHASAAAHSNSPAPPPQRVAVVDANSPAQCLELLSHGRFPLLTDEHRAEGFFLRFSPGQLHAVLWRRHHKTLTVASRNDHPPVDRPLTLERRFHVVDLAFLGDTHLAVLANNLQEFHLEFFDLRDSAARPVRVPLRLSSGATADSTHLAAAPEPGNPTRHRVLVATRPKKAPDLRLLTISTANGPVLVEDSLVPDPEREWSVPQANELLPKTLAITWDWAVLATHGRPPVAFRLADLLQSLEQLPVLPVQNIIGLRGFQPGKSRLTVAASPLAQPVHTQANYQETVGLAFSPGSAEWLLMGSRLGSRGDELALGEVDLFHVSPSGFRHTLSDRLPAGPTPLALFRSPWRPDDGAVWFAEDRADPRRSRVMQIALAQAGGAGRTTSSRAFDLTRDDDPQLFSYAFGDEETDIVVTGRDTAGPPAVVNEGSLPPYSLLLPLGADRFLTTGFDYRPRVWNLQERREEARLDYKPGFTTVGAASADGLVFALPGDIAVTATVHRRDKQGSWQTVALRLDNPPRPIAAASTLALSADGRWLLTGDRSGQAWAWNLDTLQKQRLELPGATAIRASAIRGTRAFFGTDAGKLYTVDLAGQSTKPLEVSSSNNLGKGSVAELDLSPDGRQLVQLREERLTKPGVETFLQQLWLADLDPADPAQSLNWRSLQRTELTRKTVQGTSLPEAGEQLSAVHFTSPGWIAALRRRIEGNLVQQCLWQTTGERPLTEAVLPPYVLNYPGEIGASPANSRAVRGGRELLSLHGSTIHRWRLGEPDRDLAQPGEATPRTFQHLGMFSYNMQVTDLSTAASGDLVLCASPQTGLKAYGLQRVPGEPVRIASLGQLPEGESYRGYQAVRFLPPVAGQPLRFIAAPSRALPNSSQVAAQLFQLARHPESGAALFTLEQTLPHTFAQIESLAVSSEGHWLAVAGIADGASGRRPQVLVYQRDADGRYDTLPPRLLTDAEAGANLPFQGLAFSLWKHNGEVTCCLAAGDAGDSETARVWAWDAAEKPSTDPLEPIRRCDAPGVGAVQDVAFYRDPNTNRLTLLTCTSRSLRAWDLEIDEDTGVTQLERDLTSNSLSDRLPRGAGDLLRMRLAADPGEQSYRVFLLSSVRGLLQPIDIGKN